MNLASPSKSLDEILWKKSWLSLSNSDVTLKDGRLMAPERGGGSADGESDSTEFGLGLGFMMRGVSIEIDGGERERGESEDGVCILFF